MYNQYYLEAIEMVLTWNLPDEALAEAFQQQFEFITHQSGDLNDYYPSLQ